MNSWAQKSWNDLEEIVGEFLLKELIPIIRDYLEAKAYGVLFSYAPGTAGERKRELIYAGEILEACLDDNGACTVIMARPRFQGQVITVGSTSQTWVLKPSPELLKAFADNKVNTSSFSTLNVTLDQIMLASKAYGANGHSLCNHWSVDGKVDGYCLEKIHRGAEFLDSIFDHFYFAQSFCEKQTFLDNVLRFLEKQINIQKGTKAVKKMIKRLKAIRRLHLRYLV
jgi:hypothetical protein